MLHGAEPWLFLCQWRIVPLRHAHSYAASNILEVDSRLDTTALLPGSGRMTSPRQRCLYNPWACRRTCGGCDLRALQAQIGASAHAGGYLSVHQFVAARTWDAITSLKVLKLLNPLCTCHLSLFPPGYSAFPLFQPRVIALTSLHFD